MTVPPSAVSPAATTRPAGSEPSAGPVTALRVLVAEDDDTLRDLSRRFLERMGHTVHTVPHGADAVQAALGGDFDVVLMDVHMPLLDGPQAARRIRAAGDRIRQPHIVALTAAVTTAVQDQCLTAGMDAFVTKPFTSRGLRQALQDVRAPSDVGGAGHPVPAPPTPAPPEPFDALAEFPPEVRAEVLQTYRRRSTDDIDRLVGALAAGAVTEAQFLAHRLRGASAAIGATALAQLCATIETDPTVAAPVASTPLATRPPTATPLAATPLATTAPAATPDGPVAAGDRIAALRAEFDAVVTRIEATERGHPSS